MKIIGYDIKKSIEYARKFALMRNPKYFNFDLLGGDCTNFVSQCIFAGTGVMNYTKTFGWFYLSLQERAPAWTGVDYFYNFITQNQGVGPFGREVGRDECEIGDAIQLGRTTDGYYHSLIIVGFDEDDILVAAQTDNALRRPLSTYNYDFERFIKIDGVRFEVPSSLDCFESVYNAIGIVEGR